MAADRDGELVAVASLASSPAIGKAVPFTGAAAGAIAVQGYTSPYLGVAGMKMLREGAGAAEMIQRILEGDPLRESRQILALDSQGQTAGHTGTSLAPYAGAICGQGYIVGGCGLGAENVLNRCADAYEEASGSLAERLLAVMEVPGRDEGGPGRIISAVLRISGKLPYPWIDLRIDRHARPLDELRALFAEWDARHGSICSEQENGAGHC